VLDWEINQYEQDLTEVNNYLQQRKEEQEAKIIPEINRLQRLISDLEKEVEDTHDKINKEIALEKEQIENISSLTRETEKLQEESEVSTVALNKAKTEPLRFSKNAEILHKAIGGMTLDLNKVKSDLENSESEVQKLLKDKEDHKNAILSLNQDLKNDNMLNENLQKQKDDILRKKQQAYEKEKELRNNLLELEVKLKSVQDAMKRENDNGQNFGKESYALKRKYKSKVDLKKMFVTQLNDIKKQLEEADERKEALKHDQKRQKEILERLNEENDIMKKNKMDKEDDKKDKVSRLEEIMKDIQAAENDAAKKRVKEAKLSKEMEWLSLKREYMARKASQNVSQAKETAEELKINELLLIDLKKRKQEIDFKLKSCIAMYDEVKNDRNKYVKQIQNSSQELAETKERIKILQNEVEILRSESAEKDKKLKEERHNVQITLHNRDGIRTEINKIDYAVKQKESFVTQQLNEINKLNVIINSLEKDMIELKQKYEIVCESRNYTGIQLIDRNDELCILYEKCNIQESIQKKGESEIRVKEDEIRMLSLELSAVKRQIELVRKQIPEVPQYAAEVIALQAELESEKEKEKELAAKLEDPSNSKRFNELPGEDPDEEALEAKIQVLEERLNSKKEQLLEKELVLEEISNLADRLRAQALTGRQSTLELAEKVNEFQSRIKKLTRKMMATISELSMFQATASKLKQEKERLEEVQETAQNRMKEFLPPTDDCEEEFNKMERNKIMREEEHKLRLEREKEEKGMTGGIVHSTADPRLNSYIPDDGVGLPKPYGSHAPFVPSQLGSNMRHIRKPVPKPIEI
jgi:chromosome segregation ATPase